MLPSPPLPTDPERSAVERRATPDRRAGERRTLVLVPSVDRRSTPTRRQNAERRGPPAARGAATTEHQVRHALDVLETIADTQSLDDEVRRDLDAAIFRLHFAIERLRLSHPA